MEEAMEEECTARVHVQLGSPRVIKARKVSVAGSDMHGPGRAPHGSTAATAAGAAYIRCQRVARGEVAVTWFNHVNQPIIFLNFSQFSL